MTVKTEWETRTMRFCLKVSLFALAAKTAVAARVHRQGSQLGETASSYFDK
jgi:hypothetical protein